MISNWLKVFGLLVVSVSLCGAKIYQWTDAEGNVHFSSTPPPEVMSKAETVNINTGDSGNYEVEDLVSNTWYANANKEVIELTISNSGYRWVKSGRSGGKQVETGSWQLFPTQIELTSRDSGKLRKFAVRNQRKNTVTLVDVETEVAYEFRKLDSDSRELSDNEELISGKWDEVNSREMMVGKASFGAGTFRRYNVSQGDRAFSPANPNHVIAEGNWSARGSMLVMEYAKASGKLLDKTAAVEEWEILELGYRNLILKNINSNEELRFKRKRTQ